MRVSNQGGGWQQAHRARVSALLRRRQRGPGARYHSSRLRQAVLRLCIGMPVPSDDGISSSQLFDLYLSLTRRKKVVSVGRYHAQNLYRGAEDNLNTSPGYATSLRMLGFDSIAGSLASSILHELINRQPANASAILPFRGTYRRPGFLTSSGLRRPTTCWAMPQSSKATRQLVSISIRGLSTTTQTTANAISVGGGTPVSARTCHNMAMARDERTRLARCGCVLRHREQRRAANRIGSSSTTPALWFDFMLDDIRQASSGQAPEQGSYRPRSAHSTFRHVADLKYSQYAFHLEPRALVAGTTGGVPSGQPHLARIRHGGRGGVQCRDRRGRSECLHECRRSGAAGNGSLRWLQKAFDRAEGEGQGFGKPS